MPRRGVWLTLLVLVASAGAQLAVGVAAPASPPQAAAQSFSVADGSVLQVGAPGLLAGASGAGLTVTAHTAPAHGTLSVQPDGSFTYTPTVPFSGTDGFTYTITDALGATARGTVTLGDAPSAFNQAYATSAGTPLVVAAPGVLTGSLGTSLTAVVLNGSSHGTATLHSDGSFTYTPDPGFSGTDSFTFEATDGARPSASATTTITVHPTVVSRAFGATAGQTLSVGAPGVLNGSTGTSLRAVTVTAPSHGLLGLASDGSISYTPDLGFSGSDSFTFEATDGISTSNIATATISVDLGVADQSYTTPAGTTLRVDAPGVLNRADGSSLQAVLVTRPSHGSLALNLDGSFSYTPDPGFFGADRFTFQATDGSTTSSPATATISVEPPTGAPSRRPVAFGGTVVLPSAPDGSGGSFTLASPTGNGPFRYSLSAQPGVGSVAVVPTSGLFTFGGPPGFTGVVTYRYQVSDVNGLLSDQAVVTIVVEAPPAYRLVAGDGGVFDFGSAQFERSCLDIPSPCSSVTGGAAFPDGLGYWLVGADGGVFSFGHAPFVGSLPAIGQKVDDVVGMASTGDGGGYWLVSATGAVYAFGDARFAGSLPGLRVAVDDVVGMASTGDGGGYWLTAADGGVFAFGDAPYLGNATRFHLERPIVGLATGPSGGYWLTAGDGGVFSFTPPFLGSDPAIGFWPVGTVGVPRVLNGAVVGIILTP